MEAACTQTCLPLSPTAVIIAVLGWASLTSLFLNSKSSPISFAISKLSGILISSGSKPKRPATNALSVPCPLPVAANEPDNIISAFTGFSPSSLAVISPILQAPAVCELDGPTIIGPSISKTLNSILLQKAKRLFILYKMHKHVRCHYCNFLFL